MKIPIVHKPKLYQGVITNGVLCWNRTTFTPYIEATDVA